VSYDGNLSDDLGYKQKCNREMNLRKNE